MDIEKITFGESVLVFFPIFFELLILDIDSVKNEFEKSFKWARDCKKHFYTIPYNIDCFGKRYRGIVEIKIFHEINIKICMEENFLKDLSVAGDLRYFLNELLICVSNKVLYENNVFEIKKDEILKTYAPKILLDDFEKDIFQIITSFYLKYGKKVLTFDIRDFSFFKKMDKKRIENAFYSFKNKGLISILKKFDTKFCVYFLCCDDYIISYPSKLLSLSLKTQRWQRKIGEFLYDKGGKFFKVGELLNLVKDEFSVLKPSQIRERLENTLDSLQELGIIKNWQYRYIDENKLQGKNWLTKYRNLSLKTVLNF